MNSGQILLAVIGGGIGGGLGGLLGMFLNMLRGKPSRVGIYLAISLALLGARLATWSPALLRALPAWAQLDTAGPAYQAVRRYYPEVYAKIAADAKSVDQKDPIALQNVIRPRLADLVAAHRAEMDYGSVNALGRLMLDETRALQSTSPQTCVAILGGGTSVVDMAAAFSPELGRRDSEVTAQIITQVATRPATPPVKLTAAEARTLIGDALKGLSSDEQKLVTPLLQQQKTPSGAEEARAYCAFYRELFATAMRGPDETLRRFLAH